MNQTQELQQEAAQVRRLPVTHFDCPGCNHSRAEDIALCGARLGASFEYVVYNPDPYCCPMCLTYQACPRCGVPFMWPSGAVTA